jgi:Glycosyl transferase family 2
MGGAPVRRLTHSAQGPRAASDHRAVTVTVPLAAGPVRAAGAGATAVPRVSVIVAAYQAERFLGAALESALGQDHPAELLEVVVVDDGSTDATGAIAEHYARTTGRVRVVRRPNGGNVAATNAALAHADGDVVAILDADDAWPADRISAAVRVLADRPEVGLVYGDMTVIDEDGEVLQGSWLAGDATPEGRCVGALLTGNNVTGSTIVLRGSVLRAIAPIPAWAPWTDWWLAVRCAEVSELAYLPAPRTLYRFHGANMSLGVQGERRRGELCKAAGFQRRLLRTIPAGSATPGELATAWAALERNVAEATALADSPFRSVLAVDDADRAAAARLAADGARGLDAGDAGALWTCLRAAAADPWNEAARTALARALEAAPAGGEALPAGLRRLAA